MMKKTLLPMVALYLLTSCANEVNIKPSTLYNAVNSNNLIELANEDLAVSKDYASIAKSNYEPGLGPKDNVNWKNASDSKIEGLEKLMAIPKRFEDGFFLNSQKLNLVANAQKADDIVEATTVDDILTTYGTNVSFMIPYVNNVLNPDPRTDVNYANINVVSYTSNNGHREVELDVSKNGREPVRRFLDLTTNDYTIGDLIMEDM